MRGTAYLKAIARLETMTDRELRDRRRPLFHIALETLADDLEGPRLDDELAMILLWVEWREAKLTEGKKES